MKHQTETFPPVGRLWKLPQLWKKAKRDAAFSHSCLDKPSDQTCSAYPQLPQARLSFYPLGKREQGRGACNGCLNWVRKTRHILRGWVNDGENPWVNDSENPHLFTAFGPFAKQNVPKKRRRMQKPQRRRPAIKFCSRTQLKNLRQYVSRRKKCTIFLPKTGFPRLV